ncbi:stage III sporulation protein AE [Jeotgalibacillus proteolyticus]|uniref:stage III sporulation protein AE n=1 Tax=Jeotgalibacillus proteolyticus TaxID=2082395 RepID=UPI00142F95D5|nr:stage III sporulation protein AE [Jeotgalibacillus proteolyticus]
MSPQTTLQDTQESITNEVVNEQLSGQEHEAWLGFWDQLTGVYGEYLPRLSKQDLLELLLNPQDSVMGWFSGIIRFIFHEVAEHAHIIIWLLLLLVIGSILQTLQHSFSSSGVAAVSSVAMTGLLLMVVIESVQTCAGYVIQTIDLMADFMYAMLPLYMAMLTISGSITTVAVSHPILLFIVQFSHYLMQHFLVPLFILSILLDIVDTISISFRTSKMAALCRQVGIWLLGVVVMVYISIFSVQGVTTSVTDGIGAKTVKTIAGQFIPFIGKVVADTTDLLLASSVLAKNAVGLAGALILAVMVLFPALKILVVAFMYRICAVVMEPLGHPGMVQAVDAVSKGLFHLCAALVLVSIMFLLGIVVLLVVSNIPLMIR